MTDDPLPRAIQTLLSPHGGGAGHRAERERAATILVEHGEEGHAAVRAALADASPAANLVPLIQLVPAFRRADDVPMLAQVLRSADDPIAIVAAQALAVHPDGEALHALIDALDEPGDRAAYAAQALGQRGDPSAIEPLRALAARADAAPFARDCAREAAAQLSDT
ncbi:MAG: HEAT repeat domain-containing protein [Solirubrobacteraceae bacterium]